MYEISFHLSALFIGVCNYITLSSGNDWNCKLEFLKICELHRILSTLIHKFSSRFLILSFSHQDWYLLILILNFVFNFWFFYNMTEYYLCIGKGFSFLLLFLSVSLCICIHRYRLSVLKVLKFQTGRSPLFNNNYKTISENIWEYEFNSWKRFWSQLEKLICQL